jgi:Tfp pilus assembly protein PilO
MTRPVRWMAGGAVLCLALLAAAWFVLVSPTRAKAAETAQQADAAQTSLAVKQAQLQTLLRQQKNLPTATAALSALKARVPADLALPDLLRDISATATSTHVDVTTVSPSAPTPVTATSVTGKAVSGVYATTVAMTVTGSYFDLSSFLHALEQLPRTYSVTGLQLALGGGSAPGSAAGTASNPLTATITSVIFTAPPVGTTSTPTTGTATPAGSVS